MEKRKFAGLVVLAVQLLILPWSARAEGENQQPIIEAIEGDKVVVVKTPKGNRVAERGSRVNIGDRVKTGPRASAKIRFADGSKMLIGRNTEMEVQKNQDGVQWNQVHAGEVRGVIKKPKVPVPSGKPRFAIRSRAAVMGVRGTDFVYNVDSAAVKSEVHTLEGLVEVAKDEEALMSGKGVTVQPDQYVSADGTAVSTPQAFDREVFLNQLHEAQPEFVALARNDPDLGSRVHVRPPRELERARGPIRLLNFQLNTIYILQQSGGQAISGEISWNPVVDLFGPVSVRGFLGVFPLKGRVVTEKFFGLEFGGVVSLSFLEPFLLEAGAGGQTWVGFTRPNLMLLGNVAWRVGAQKFIERIFAGAATYDTVSDTGVVNNAIELRLGVGLQF